MVPAQKATYQSVAPTIASKGKNIINVGTSNAEFHPPNLNVVLQQVEEERSSLATPPEGADNEPESCCLPDGNSSNCWPVYISG